MRRQYSGAPRTDVLGRGPFRHGRSVLPGQHHNHFGCSSLLASPASLRTDHWITPIRITPIPRQVLLPRESLMTIRCPCTVRRPPHLRRQQPQSDCEFSGFGGLAIDDPRPRSKNARRGLDCDGLIRCPPVAQDDSQSKRTHVLGNAGVNESMVFETRDAHGHRQRCALFSSSSSGIHLGNHLLTGPFLACWTGLRWTELKTIMSHCKDSSNE
jgi:hypothetical protein